MTTATTNAIELEAKITDIETAQTERWLATMLAPARRAIAAGPSDDAIARMRYGCWAKTRGRLPGRLGASLPDGCRARH